MAITSVKEIWNGRTGEVTAKKYQRAYVRTFRILTDSRLDGPVTILASRLLPRLGTLYIEPSGRVDFGVSLKHKKCKIDQSEPLAWEVSCEYDNEPADPEKSQEQESKDENSDKQADDPNDRFTEVSFSFHQFQKAIQKDLDGKAIANSAGAPFNPPVEIDDSRPVITVKRNEAAFNFGVAGGFKDCVNAGGYMGYGAGQVKLFNISATRKYAENKISWEVSYEFHVRPEGWQLQLLDQGFWELPAAGQEAANRDFKDNNVLQHPMLLDGNGKRLKPAPGQNIQGTFLNFRVYPKADFNALGLF